MNRLISLKDAAFWLFIACMALCASRSKAQTVDQEIITVVQVFLDDKKVETDKVLVSFSMTNSIHSYAKISSEFTTYLKPNKLYKMTITHPGYNVGKLQIDTSGGKCDSINCSVYLSSNDTSVYYAYYKYNEVLKKYIVYQSD